MRKILKENCLILSIYDLKRSIASEKRQYSAVISWGERGSLSIFIDKQEKYLKLDYWADEEQIKYTVRLTSTDCYYSHKRYWFICPNNQCGQRVANLYLAPNKYRFACRHCLNLSYRSRNINPKGRLVYLDKMLKMEKTVKNLNDKMKIKHRKGWPTKKYLQLMKANDDLELAIDMVDQKMEKLLKK